VSIKLVDPYTEQSVTLHESREWSGEHLAMLRAAQSVPIPSSELHKVDPVLAQAEYVAKVLELEVIPSPDRRAPPPIPPDAIA